MLAEGLIVGWTGEAGRIKNLLGTDVENALNALTSRVTRILDKQRRPQGRAVEAAFRSRLSRFRHCVARRRRSQAARTCQGRSPRTPPATRCWATSRRSRRLRWQGCSSSLRILLWARRHHLNPTDLMQIANLGAAQGDQILQQLLSGDVDRDAEHRTGADREVLDGGGLDG
jgi:hypothetical protein